MGRPTRVEIDTSTFSQNLLSLKKINGPSFFCPMVKANAYGHGVSLLAPVVEKVGADMMGVALLEEGVMLRELGIQMPILVFGPVSEGDASIYHKLNLTPVVGRFSDLDHLGPVEKRRSFAVHLKFNTGMQRLGFDQGDMPTLRAKLKDSSHLRVEGVCTHLTHGEDIRDMDGPSARQFRRFLAMTEGFPGVRHAHKSASLAAGAEGKPFAEIGARPGISLYGLPHDSDRTGPGLVPVLRWVTELINIHVVEKGEAVSYGARWVAPRRSVIGVVPLGYGDGYSRSLSNKGSMLFRGMRVPVVGSVCMDYTLLDLSAACAEGEPKAGEPIVVLGRQGEEELTAFELAELCGTIAYEVVTAISNRVKRVAI